MWDSSVIWLSESHHSFVICSLEIAMPDRKITYKIIILDGSITVGRMIKFAIKSHLNEIFDWERSQNLHDWHKIPFFYTHKDSYSKGPF